MLAEAFNPVLDYAEEQTGRARLDLFKEMVEFLYPYDGDLDEGLKKYIEKITEP